MGGTKYSNGFTVYGSEGNVLINLNSRYSNINFTVSHVDNTDSVDQTVSFFVDGRLVKELFLSANGLPQQVFIPTNYGLQLKIVTSKENPGLPEVGFGNITIQ